MKHKMIMGIMLILGAVMLGREAGANNIAVTNVSLTGGGEGYVNVRCDISWDHSWRETWIDVAGTATNWDAAWVFVKFRYGAGNWLHASLATNDSEHTAPAGSTLDVGLTDTKGMGVFLYRSELGAGSWTNTVLLRWNYAQDGVASTSIVDVCVHAIEMVYVPQGSFALGSGGDETGHFYKDPTVTDVYMVTNEGAITTSTTDGDLWGTGGTSGEGAVSPADPNDIPAAFPKGYAAFYCMKYEISQGQYADFLNQLTSAQASTRAYTGGADRHTITGSHPNYSASVADRACNFMSWADGSAYADWAGLRPMTELEFEKACRGPALPFANEYAWGNTTISATTGLTGDGTPQETANNGNCNYDASSPEGPFRCGIYATTNSTRQAGGATYWGIMEMSGNLWERAVTIGNADGRTFTGLHGNGVLTGGGDADVSNWPSPTTASGAGARGGTWGQSATYARASYRYYAAAVGAYRGNLFGWRAVRAAP